MSDPLLKVENLTKHYALGLGFLKRTIPVVRAVEDVSFSVKAGETLCIVGESGCGKSTIARLLMRIVEPTSGHVLIDGTDIADLKRQALRAWRRRMQMVFQIRTHPSIRASLRDRSLLNLSRILSVSAGANAKRLLPTF